MQLTIPAHDCLVSGLGMYFEHKQTNPLQGHPGADMLVDEHLQVYFRREPGNDALNLREGVHFPMIIGKKCSSREVAFVKPKDMEGMFMPLQAGFTLLYMILDEVTSGAMQTLQLHVGVQKDEEYEPIPMTPRILHRFIRA